MKKITILGVAFLMCLLMGTTVAAQEFATGADVAVTNTSFGKVRGYISNDVFTYKGIPYAQSERFQAPQKPDAWEGVRSSTTYGPVAPLLNPTTQVSDEAEFVFDHDWGYTSEKCQVLNVWSPSISDSNKRPVLFWIHGGGFTAGSSQELPSYDGENLSKNGDVVVVSVNHRLNVLGFLDLSAYGEEYKNSANNSMLDLVAALHWVRDNISNFGGDPNNVTIFGQSGGGAKVNTLMSMPMAQGLFHKAINQSGAIRGRILEQKDTRAIAEETLKALGLTAENIDSLKKVPFEKLSKASSKALSVVAERKKAAGEPVIGFGLNWGPSQNGDAIPYQPASKEVLEMNKNIPLMIGTTKNEFATFANMTMHNASLEEVMANIKETMGDKADAYVKAVKKAYPNDTKPTDLITIDTRFRPGAVVQANAKADYSNEAPVFMYLFDWQSPVFDGKYMAVHCMELPFVFDNIDRCKNMTGGGTEAHALADKMSKAWLAFAKTGNPNHDGLPEWPVYDSKNTATMHFDNTCTVSPQRDKELLELVKSM